MKPAPFGNCMFHTCDLPGQCLSEGKCHHPLREPSDVDGMRAKIAAALHYPDCWDTAAYPTLEHAMHESLHNFMCSEHATPSAPSVDDLARDEREAFEAWASGKGICTEKFEDRTGQLLYIAPAANDGWQAWQARAALSEKGEAAAWIDRCSLEELKAQGDISCVLHIKQGGPNYDEVALYTAPPAASWQKLTKLLEAAEDVIGNGHQHYVGGGDYVFLGTCNSTERLQRAIDACRTSNDSATASGKDKT